MRNSRIWPTCRGYSLLFLMARNTSDRTYVTCLYYLCHKSRVLWRTQARCLTSFSPSVVPGVVRLSAGEPLQTLAILLFTGPDRGRDLLCQIGGSICVPEGAVIYAIDQDRVPACHGHRMSIIFCWFTPELHVKHGSFMANQFGVTTSVAPTRAHGWSCNDDLPIHL